jgi:glycosyltransferase involved in cell wall biosynthesis
MVGQAADEVIVVDFSCPQGTGDFVAANFPSVRVVSVPGEEHYSNWKARNAGALAASSEILVFADADTILAEGAIDRLSEHMPDRVYGFFDRKTSESFNRAGPRVAANQLKGFHVMPAAAFRRVGGYDEVLEGYASGADTDMEERLSMIGLKRHALDPRIVESVIEHDAASRTQHHAHPIRTSYCAGLIYRTAKLCLLRMRSQLELPLAVRRNLYSAAIEAARSLGPKGDRIGMNVLVGQEPVLMPRQLGYESGRKTVMLRVEVSLRGKLSEVP